MYTALIVNAVGLLYPEKPRIHCVLLQALFNLGIPDASSAMTLMGATMEHHSSMLKRFQKAFKFGSNHSDGLQCQGSIKNQRKCLGTHQIIKSMFRSRQSNEFRSSTGRTVLYRVLLSDNIATVVYIVS